MVEKVVRDGMVAVILSRGYGAGWSTWADTKENQHILAFHPKLVELIESGKVEEMRGTEVHRWVESVFGITGMYFGGWDGLYIKWIAQGTRFRIDEYDGAEYIITEADLPYIA